MNYSQTPLQSTHALRTPRYNGHPLNPRQKQITEVWLKKTPAITDTR